MPTFDLPEAELPLGPLDPASRFDVTYCVTGFRSLHEFHVILRPGLNVLLGSNGSGKTNFIDFLDFITSLVSSSGATAISGVGGVARVFSQETLKRKIPRVTAKIMGLADLSQFIPGNIKNQYFRFEYEVDIRYSRFHSAVYIAHERMKFKNLHSNEFSQDAEATVGSIELYRRSPSKDDAPRWKVGHYLTSSSHRNPLRYVHRHRVAASPSTRKPLAITDTRVEQLSETPVLEPDESILATRSPFPAYDAVRYALSRGKSFNLDPHRARQPDDISSVPIIGSDGSGLSATIYQMQQAKKAGPVRPLVRRRFGREDLDTIIGWTQLVLPELRDITATADPHTGKYLVYLIVGDDNQNLRIPLQSTSDGTLKWLAFVCLVVSHGADYTFEEPENFLHPKMQQYLIALLRDSIDEDSSHARFVVSTHSETIINQCQPEELILFSFDGGRTHCKRLTNVQAVIDQVNETGFGLGHYYSQNVLY